jgi:hypothetical protein
MIPSGGYDIVVRRKALTSAQGEPEASATERAFEKAVADASGSGASLENNIPAAAN